MRESSAIELRDRWVDRLRRQVAEPGLGAAPGAGEGAANLAIGVSGEGDRRLLAVRLQDRSAATLAAVDAIAEEARGEVEVREIGEVVALAPTVRPLVGGISIGNAIGDPGTLGCIVRKKGIPAGPFLLLSNNHVLARIGFAEPGEAIEQPAAPEQTGGGPFAVAEFGEAVPLEPRPSPNRVDAAVVPVLPDVACAPGTLFGSSRRLAGVRTAALRAGEPVFKVGKSTSLTEGKIHGQGMRMLTVSMGSLRFDFDDQIEILPATSSFCLPGDSGSIVFDDADLALGLLFAKSRTSEEAYANPLAAVLSALSLELA